MKITKIVLLLISPIILISCYPAKPMTKKIDRAASLVGEINKFQYYVSRNIVLTKTNDPDIIGEIKTKGSLKVTKNKDVIQITSSTCGALLKTTTSNRDNKVFHIAFEADNDNCLRFEQNRSGSEQKLYLQYDIPHKHAVIYGGDVFVVEWSGAENLNKSKLQAKIDNWFAKVRGFFKGIPNDEKDNPYLLVKMNVKVDEKEQYRKASGRKVQ